MAIRKADPVYPDIFGQLIFATPRIEHMHMAGQVERAGDRVFRVMVALDVERLDPGLSEAIQFRQQERARACGAFLSVKEIPGDQQRRHLFGNRVINQLAESRP